MTFGGLASAVPFLVVLIGGWRERFTSDFLDAQARALLDGHLSVPRSVFGLEGFVIDGEVHTYFGLVPALLRLPFMVVDLDGRLAGVMMLAAFVLLVMATGDVVEQVRYTLRGDQPATTAERTLAGWFVFGVGAGSVVLFLAAVPTVYHEVELWGAAFGVVAVGRLLRFTGDPTSRRAATAVLAVALVVFSRASVGLGALVVLAGLAVLAAWRQPPPWLPTVPRSTLRWLAGGTALIVAGYVALNQARFGTWLDLPFDQQIFTEMDANRRSVLDAHGSVMGLVFAPTAALAYLRPDALDLSWLPPFVEFAGPARVVGDVRFESLGPASSLTATMPLATLLAVAGTWVAVRRDAGLRVVVAGALLGALPMTAIALVAHRYLADAVPWLVVAGAVGLLALADRLPVLRWRAVVLPVVVVLTAWSAMANAGLAIAYQRLHDPAHPDVRHAFLDTRAAFDEAAFFGADWVDTGPDLGPPPAAGRVRIVGDCRGVYWSDGMRWHLVERADGHVRVRVDGGGNGSLVVGSSAGEQTLVVNAFGHEVFVSTDGGATAAARVVADGDAFTVDVIADPDLDLLRVDVDGTPAFEGELYGVEFELSAVGGRTVAPPSGLCDRLSRAVP